MAMRITVPSKGARRKGTPGVQRGHAAAACARFPDKPPFRVFEMPAVEAPEPASRESTSEPARVLENS